MNKIVDLVFALFVALFLSACGSDNESPAQITSTQSLSQHFVEINFDKSVSQEALAADDVLIVSGTGQKLDVKNVSFFHL